MCTLIQATRRLVLKCSSKAFNLWIEESSCEWVTPECTVYRLTRWLRNPSVEWYLGWQERGREWEGEETQFNLILQCTASGPWQRKAGHTLFQTVHCSVSPFSFSLSSSSSSRESLWWPTVSLKQFHCKLNERTYRSHVAKLNGPFLTNINQATECAIAFQFPSLSNEVLRF